MIVWKRRDKAGTTIHFCGKRLQGLRLSLSLSQAQAATAIGVTRAAVSVWESEQRCPTLPMIERLVAFYGDALSASGACIVSTEVTT